ncbi:hypothetical protein DMA12_18250 [Amycolatopsis balhimycina DSM 5908]|uniref:SH3 domain-containing protein n=1 Tax=Amycolatopsis balhimycina DSM 5908 TaxID=1081091 RepID=A0A428WL49_AMYBA|nr:hypothetical protein [Amycolatopsis balhimycina]RSM43814.1 hypothetical protein DMA12_18250 [Amycolatopsis balhimycina DSM 5908]
MRVLRKYLITAALTVGFALAGVLGATGASAAEAPAIAEETASQTAVPQPGYIWVARQNIVFSEYGGPSSIGSTAAEMIYAQCQHNGIWGWQTYAWVPSLNSWGWLRNGDITGFTDPIWWLDVC